MHITKYMGGHMIDKGLGVLEQYGMTLNRSSRVKGALLLDTDCGCFLLKEFHGNEKHLELEDAVQSIFLEDSCLYVDGVVRNQKGQLVSIDSDGLRYCLKRWYIAKDCDVWNSEMLYQAVRTLALFHKKTEAFLPQNCTCAEDGEENSGIWEEFERHNRELKRCRNFIRKRNRKNEFERLVLESFEEFYKRGLELAGHCSNKGFRQLEEDTVKKGSVVHGTFNYHNILFVGEKGFLTNFEHCKIGLQLRDLYDFLRKVLEKHSWNYELGHRLIEEYGRIHTLSQLQLEYLKVCLSYPEKYWKIVSHYYNTGKSWIPDKDIEKLKVVILQEDQKQRFLRSL